MGGSKAPAGAAANGQSGPCDAAAHRMVLIRARLGRVGCDMRICLACAALLACLLPALPARAELDAALAAAGWRELRFARLDPNDFRREGAAIVIDSERSASLIWRPADVATLDGGRLAWRWCVTASVPPTDIGRRGGDDRAAILYVAFAEPAADPDDELAGFARAYDRSPLAGTVLGYVWGGTAAGRWVDNPWLPGRGKFRVLASATARGCRAESVDLAADYRAAFGAAMPAVAAIAVGADTDDTRSRSRIRLELGGAGPRP
jgi:hypothetical protein